MRNLTNLAIEVFGDIVEWAVTEETDVRAGFENDNGMLEPYLEPIFVKFKNGKKFYIWASEWGGAVSVDSTKNRMHSDDFERIEKEWESENS